MPDRIVIEELVGSHRQFLSFLEKRVESRVVAEDILQSAFARSLERADELRDNESAVAWFSPRARGPKGAAIIPRGAV